MKILGLDLSLRETGFCVIDDYGNILYKGVIKPKLRGIKRLVEIRDRIEELIDRHKPTIFVVENYSFGSRGGRAFSIGELGGVIKTLIYEKTIGMNDFIYLIPPALLKKFITGKGNAPKNLMLLHTYKKYNIVFTNDNACDSFCLAIFIKKFTDWKAHKKGFKSHEIQCFVKLDSLRREKTVNLQ